MPDPIYKDKQGQRVTKQQLLNSGYTEERINKGLERGVLNLVGDTDLPDQSYKTKDGQNVTTRQLLESGYSQERINNGVYNGVLEPEESISFVTDPVKKKVGSIAYPEYESEAPSTSKPQSDIVGLANEYSTISGRISATKKNISYGSVAAGTTKPSDQDKNRLVEIQKSIEESGYDPQEILETFSGFPVDAKNVNVPALLQEKKDNPLGFQRHISAYKWQTPLFKAIREKDKEGAGATINALLSKQAEGTYIDKRLDTKNILSAVNEYIDDSEERDRITKEIINDRSIGYGMTDKTQEEAIYQDERHIGKGGSLNAYQVLGIQFMEDTDPKKAELYSRYLKAKPKGLWGEEDLVKGYELKMKQLEDLGMSLQAKGLDEKLTGLVSKHKQGQLTEAESQEYERLYEIYSTLETDAKEQGQRYPQTAAMEADRLAQEASGQRKSSAQIFALTWGRNTGDKLDWLNDIIMSPFRSEEEKTMDDLEELGDAEFYNKVQAYIPEYNRLVQEDGKINFTPKAIFNTIANVGGEIISNIDATAIIGAKGKVGNLSSLFGSTFANTYNDYYTEAIRNDIPNPTTYATTHTAIEAATELINPDLGMVKKLIKPNSAFGQIVKNVTKEEWDDILKASKGRFSNVLSALKQTGTGAVKNAFKETLEEVAGQLGGNVADVSLFNQDVDLIDGMKSTIVNTLVGTLPLGFLGLPGQFTQLNRQQKYALYEVAQNKEKYLPQLELDVKNGVLTKEKAEQVKTIIENASNSLNQLSEKDAINANQADNEKTEVLAESLGAAAEAKPVVTPEGVAKPVDKSNLEGKIYEIQRRRRDDLNKEIHESGYGEKEGGKFKYVGGNDVFGATHEEVRRKINEDYDTELAELEKPSTPQVKSEGGVDKKTDIKNRRKTAWAADMQNNDGKFYGYYETGKPDPNGGIDREMITGNSEKEVLDKINEKYDAELSALEKQQSGKDGGVDKASNVGGEAESKPNKVEQKTWRDFMSYKEKQDIPESIQRMDEKQVRDLLSNKKAKWQHSMTSSNDKQRLRGEVWQLESIVKAYDKANEANKSANEMANFDFDKLYSDAAAETNKQNELDTKKKEVHDANVKSVTDAFNNKIAENEAQINDWQNRKYKGNEDVVYKGGDDIHGEGMSIGAINEGKRQKKIKGFQSENESLSKAKEILSNYDYNREGNILDNIKKDFQSEDYMRNGKKMSAREQIILDDAYDKIITYLKQNPPKAVEQSLSKQESESAKPPTPPIAEAKQEGGEPPLPPPPVTPTEAQTEQEGGENKSLANRLVVAKNVPEAAKEGIRKAGLKYEPSSQQEAHDLAKVILDEAGIGDAVLQAQAGKFGGDVNTLVQTEALNRLYDMEVSAKTQNEKIEHAKKFAEISIHLDESLRKQGRGIAAVNFFYKKSPLGIQMVENANRKRDFNEWSKPKEKNWKEFFDEMMKEPEFETIVKEQVAEQLKKERAEARAARIKKVDDAIDKAKDQFKGGAAYSTIIPPQVITAALEGIKKAYHAGEAVAKIVQDAIDYISKELGHDNWDKEKFRSEWEEKLKDKEQKKPLTDEELKQRILNKFRNKLKGLTEAQKDEVIRRAHKQLIENGALEYEDFRQIIARVTGKADLTAEEAAHMKTLVEKVNAVEDAAVKVRTERTDESMVELNKAEIEAGRAAKELNELFHNKPDIIKRLTSIMQLSTLGIPALVNNPIYNIWNQMALRFPIGVVNDTIDRSMSAAATLAGRTYDKEYNVWQTQKEFWSKLGLGTKEAFTQFGTGLTRQDYIDKEIVTQQQIRPLKSLRDLAQFAKGKKPLTKKQFWDKLIQGTVGIPAEAVARTLNLGDKPQRFAAEGAQGSAFAKTLGLQGMDYKIFIKFPREEAYRNYKAQGLSDEVAGQKADYIKDAIVKEGQRSTFQQDNLLNDAITRAAAVLGGKDSGTAQLTKALVISPYIKIPSNAFWSLFNLINPEVAVIQAGVHAANAKRLSNKGEVTKSKLQNREARYWVAHAVVGIAMRAVVIGLVKAGIFIPGSDDDDSKKERDAASFYDKPGYVNTGDIKISNRWFGFIGMMGNVIAKKWKDATPEQREAQDDFWNIALGGMEMETLQELENGVFSNSSSLLQSLSTGDWGRYGMNTLNMFTNIIQPASIAQINRAALDEVPTSKGDTFLTKLNNNFAQRSTVYRKLFNVQLDKKRDVWGQTIPKGGNILSRMFGISKANPQLFARPMYEDYLRTQDSGFLPPAVLPTLNGKKLDTKQGIRLEEYVGGERKKLVEPYINDMAEVPITSKKYSELNDEKKKDVLQYLYGRGRERGLELFYKDFPEFRPKEKSIDDVIDNSLWDATKTIMKVNEPK